MTLKELLRDLVLPPSVADDGSGEAALAQLETRLRSGHSVVGAAVLASTPGLLTRDGVVLFLAPPDAAGDDGADALLVGLSAASRTRLLELLPDVHVRSTGASRDSDAPETAPPMLARQMAERFESTSGLAPESRAASLMEWIMESVDASRCALVPVEGGAMGEPLAFHARGRAASHVHRRRLPRTVLEAAARSRQPLVSHDVSEPAEALPASVSVERQGVRSYMAVPVVFQGDLLAVAYVDRFDRPRRFSLDEQVTFQALAYELARPIIELRDERRHRELDALRDGVLMNGATPAAVPTSEALRPVLARARDMAPHADEPLLILGETGVGKEWLARFVHESSGRTGPFVAVNLSAIPNDLVMSELMGSVRGAFTGALDRPGRILEAEQGTLLLDEIGDLDLGQQVRLLRFLQDRRVRAVGARTEREADVRIVAATNRPVHELVKAGAFRADLLHRFGPPLVVPPLRQRRSEILPLAEAWLASKARQRGLTPHRLTDDARNLLERHHWPGNVRQLQAVLSHALLIAKNRAIDRPLLEELLADSLEPASATPVEPPQPSAGTLADFRAQLDAQEAAWLRAALERNGGNVDATARALDCPGTSLRHLLARHDLLPKKR